MIENDDADRELVTATISMAHGLGLQVIAEGVETAGQHEFLVEQNCDFAQGYLYGKALAADQFERLFLESKA